MRNGSTSSVRLPKYRPMPFGWNPAAAGRPRWAAARLLLDVARSTAPTTPVFVGPLLRLCQRVALPETVDWFLEELRVAAERPQDFAARWPERRQRNEVFFAALRQARGDWPGAPA